jgi:hypothetical protein
MHKAGTPQAGEDGLGSDEVFGAGGGELQGPARAGAARATRRAAAAKRRIGITLGSEEPIRMMHIRHALIKGNGAAP